MCQGIKVLLVVLWVAADPDGNCCDDHKPLKGRFAGTSESASRTGWSVTQTHTEESEFEYVVCSIDQPF